MKAFSVKLILLITATLALTACSDSGDSRPTVVMLPEIAGDFKVGHTFVTATDSNRNGRRVKIDIWYPVDEANFMEEPKTVYSLLG